MDRLLSPSKNYFLTGHIMHGELKASPLASADANSQSMMPVML